MSSRRKFIGEMLGGTATLAASSLASPRSALGASDRVRLGLIGAGGRGQKIFKTALRCPKTEAVGVAAETPGPSSSAPDIVGGSDETLLHMQNFIDCVRSRKEPNCPLEIGFRSAIACQMAIISYRQGRSVSWDPQREDIV